MDEERKGSTRPAEHGGALDTGTEGGGWDLCIWGPRGHLLLRAGEAAVPSWPGPPLSQGWGPLRGMTALLGPHPGGDLTSMWQWMSHWDVHVQAGRQHGLIPLLLFFFFFRKKKKILKEQRKQRERVELKMDLPGVSIADDGDTSMFSLRTIHRTPVCGAGGGLAPRAIGLGQWRAHG